MPLSRPTKVTLVLSLAIIPIALAALSAWAGHLWDVKAGGFLCIHIFLFFLAFMILAIGLPLIGIGAWKAGKPSSTPTRGFPIEPAPLKPAEKNDAQ